MAMSSLEKENLKISEKLALLTKIAIPRSVFEISREFFSFGPLYWCPSFILHKICLIGPSEAVKQVRVKLTPLPRAVEGKIPPVRARVKIFLKGP